MRIIMESEQAAPGDEDGSDQKPVRWSWTSVAAIPSASFGLAVRLLALFAPVPCL